jgi:hypothetical protein
MARKPATCTPAWRCTCCTSLAPHLPHLLLQLGVGDMSFVVAGVANEEHGVLDSLVDDKATARAQKPSDDVHKAQALGADGGSEWRCQLASLWQATRLAGECPDPQQVSYQPGVSRRGGVGGGSRSCDGVATARGGSGGKIVVAAKQRWREVGCFLARAVDPAGEGNKSDAKAWRRRTSACRDNSRLLTMGTEPFRQTDALSSSSQEYRVPAL